MIDTITEWVKDYSSVEGYYIGTVLKYLARAPYKGKKLEDLKKASFYLQEAIEYIEKVEKEKTNNMIDNISLWLDLLSNPEDKRKPNKVDMSVNNTDKLMKSIKNGTYGDKLKGNGK